MRTATIVSLGSMSLKRQDQESRKLGSQEKYRRVRLDLFLSSFFLCLSFLLS
jgi:hypothetical protein